MAELDEYISEARAKGMTDARIRKSLESEGWDKESIDEGLSGLSIPKPPSKSDGKKHHSEGNGSTGPLQSALHHVLLWFFLGSSSISIGLVTASLFGANVSTTALASLIAVTLVTFTPYVVFFVLFLRQVRKTPKIIPGKVWSIITICLASIGAMASAITLVVSLVTSAHISLIVSSTLLIALYVITLIIYGFATFASSSLMKFRKIVLIIALPAFAVLMGTLFVMSLLQLGPAKHDEAIRTELSKTVQSIKIEVSKTGILPSAADAKSLITDPSITYTLKSSSTYELCATFQTGSEDSLSYPAYYAEDLNQEPISDSYTYDSNFFAPSGMQCFVIQSDQLALPQKDNL